MFQNVYQVNFSIPSQHAEIGILTEQFGSCTQDYNVRNSELLLGSPQPSHKNILNETNQEDVFDLPDWCCESDLRSDQTDLFTDAPAGQKGRDAKKFQDASNPQKPVTTGIRRADAKLAKQRGQLESQEKPPAQTLSPQEQLAATEKARQKEARAFKEKIKARQDAEDAKKEKKRKEKEQKEMAVHETEIKKVHKSNQQVKKIHKESKPKENLNPKNLNPKKKKCALQ